MLSGTMKVLLVFAIIVLPFQLLGMIAYFILVKSNPLRARRAGVLVPAATFFATFLVLFLWRYFHPGMLMLAEGGINLIILVVMVAGAALNLGCGALLYFILYRRIRAGKV
jgi:hypothetical protein